MAYIQKDEDLFEDKSKQSRRWMITINNPFGTDIEEIDLSKNELPVKEDYYDKSIIEDFESSDLFNFKYIKVCKKLDEDKTEEFIIRRPFFKNVESAQQYFSSLESYRYSIFNIERGEEEETEHIQLFIIFNSGKRFKTLRNMLPFAHIEPAHSSSVQCREYCSKSETKIEGPFEDGDFGNERAKKASVEFIDLVQAGTSALELQKLYPNLYLKHHRDLDSIYMSQFEKYKYDCRDIEVTYIYGPSRSGKSRYVQSLVGGRGNVYSVSTYENSAFTGYRGEDNIIIDEYKGQFAIQTFNRMLDVYPFKLRGLKVLECACYHHVYIISNYPPKDIYRNEFMHEPEIYRAFNLRLHRILKFCSSSTPGKYVVERETEWEDCTNQDDIKMGLTKQVKCTYEFDSYGNKIYLFNRHGSNGELQEIPSELSPFGEERVQTELEF